MARRGSRLIGRPRRPGALGWPVSADRKGDAWMRAQAKPRGRIEPEPVKREPTTGELATAAIRNAARRSVRRIAPPTDNDADQ